MGSLLTAVASYLDIKSRKGRWLLRIDDLDGPRTAPGAIQAILDGLAAHGLIPDAAPSYQSQHLASYAAAAERLKSETFYCTCTRSQLRGVKVYPGTCRTHREARPYAALRLRVSPDNFALLDELREPRNIDAVTDVGDTMLQRRDGPWAYNFATAIDDGSNFERVVRGADLYDVTAAQVMLMRRLGLSVPSYAHLPLLCFADGTKLSKQSHAPALDNSRASANVAAALSLLGLDLPGPASEQSPAHWLHWAVPLFDLQALPKQLPAYVAD